MGCVNLASLLVAMINTDLLGIFLKMFTATWFIIMMVKDSKWRRFGFFASYLAEVLIQFIIELYVFYDLLSDPSVPHEVC